MDKPRRNAGFTLVEMMVIAPIVILAITGLIAVMVVMVGDVMQTHKQNSMTYQAQAALNQIEQDVRLSSDFLTTSDTLPSYQGSNDNFNGSAAFDSTDNDTLILNTVATDRNPDDPDRSPIYLADQPYTCGPQESLNDLFEVQIIYFIKDSSLWRRTVVPPTDSNPTCDQAWQQNSCSPGHPAVSQCSTDDIELMQDITDLDIDYLLNPIDITAIDDDEADTASTIVATITGESSVAGTNVTSQSTIRASKHNAI